MIVDSLAFLGDSLHGPLTRASDLLERMDDVGIDVAVVCPVKPRGYRLEAANEFVAEAVRDHPDRLVGFARVDPHLGDEAVAELERCVKELDLRGLFLHPWEETFRVSAPIVDRVLEMAWIHDLPVIVAAGYPWLSEGLQIGDLAWRHDRTPIVATNGCQINISGLGQTDAELALADNANLFVQTAGVYREDFIEGVAARFGAERILFASGFPHLDPRLEILRVRWAPNLDEEARELILGGNAARLLGL